MTDLSRLTIKIDPLIVEIAIAKAIATIAHSGQTTKSDRMDYASFHCAAVAERVSDDLKPTAWLHDVLEDTIVTIEDLMRCGISQTTIVNVLQLTRDKSTMYDYYIEKLCESGNVGAMVVKLADLDHNLRPSCSPALRRQYEAATLRVTNALVYWEAEYKRIEKEQS